MELGVSGWCCGRREPHRVRAGAALLSVWLIPMLLGMARYLLVLVILIVAGSSFGQEQTSAQPKQFIYVLHLVSRLFEEQAWTKEDHAAVDQHFNRLKEATERGQVILAGRTAESLDKTFGIVVFEAKDQEAALGFMNGDPAVVAGVMTAELHPFSVALARKSLE